MHGKSKIIPPKPTRPLPIISLMTDDFCGTVDVITIHPEAFAITRKQIVAELRDLICNWMEARAE
jgi:hypothetical protein